MTIIANNSPAEIEQLLLQLTVPDTDAVRVATKHLKKILSKVSSVTNLLCVLSTSANANSRQLSAVYLRKKIGGHWPKLQNAERQQTQAILLERFIQEPVRQVKNAIGGVVTVVAKCSLSNGGWPHLLPFLESLCKHSDAIMREMSYRVFRILLSTMGKTMRAHLAVLRAMFHSGLEDPALCVKTEALKALGTMAQFLDDPATLEWFQSILEPMLGALQTCVVNQADSEVAILAIEVLEELADDPKDVLQAKLVPIISTVLAIAANPNVEMDVRERSAVMISSVIDHRAATLMESPTLIEQLINGSMQILLESCNAALETSRDQNDEDDEDDEDEFSSNCRGIAVQILDQCVLNLPDVFVYPRVMSAISAMMSPANASPASRRAALFALMVSVEGAANSMKADFQSILSLVLQGLSDADSVVREAACLAIGQLSDHMTESMTQHHIHVVQAIIACMEHPSSTIKVKRKLCLAIEAMCTELDSGACVEYAPILMQRLFQLMQQHSDKLQLLEAAINAVAAVAKNTEAAFKPFFEQTVTFLHSAMKSADENHASLKAAAMQCAGAVLLSTGETGPCLPLMQLSLDTFQNINDPAVREGAFHFWSQICQLLQSDFAPYIETVVHLCLEIIDSENGMNFKSTKADLNAEFGGGSASSDDEDQEESLGEYTNDGSHEGDEDDFDGNVRCSILSGYLDEKVAAVDCLTAICRCTGPSAIKYFDHILECFELLAEYPHENVRLVAMKGLHDLVQQARVLYPSQQEGVVSKQAQDYIDRVLPILVTLVTDDESRDVVASSLDAVLSLILKYRNECVPVFQEHIADIVRMVKTVVDCESECDKYPIADVEKDSVLDSACDLIGGLAMAFKANFVPMLDQLMQSIVTRFNKGDQLTQALLLGALGEAVEALEGVIAPALGHILQLSFNSITSDHARLRRNAAFCSGACFVAAPLDSAMASQSLSHLVQICHHLANVQSSDEHFLAATDNICSALCKLITGPSSSLLNYDVDSVFKTIVMLCPLKNDMDECKFVYRTLGMLWPSVKQQTKFALSMLQVFSSAVLNSELEADLKATLAPTLQLVAKSYAKDLDLSVLSPEQADLCRQALHH